MMDVKFEVDDMDISYTYVNGVKGLLRHADFKILKSFTENIPTNGTYVETGSYLGCSATIAAFSVKRDVKIFAHDIWKQSSSLYNENYFFEFYNNIKKNNLENIVIPIRGDSSWTLGIHDNESIDVAFIDGDHSYEGITKDLNAILPKMKKGGCILCHDCSEKSDTLRGLIDFSGDKYQIYGFPDTNMKMIQV